jgi:Tfp pilus assembly protein PilN
VTVLTSETRLIGTGTGLLPRVNLLPPEIAEKRAFRRVQMGLGAGVVAAVAVVGVLAVSAAHSVSAAEEELATANTRNAQLKTEVTQYNNVTAIYAQATAAQTQLYTAMGDEVRFSQLLNDLSLSIPGNVWLKNLTYTQAPAAVAATPAAAAAAAAAGTAPIGTFTVTGVGFSHDDVALWLESVAGLKTYDRPYFSNSTEALLGTKPTVNFTGTADITPKALSGRYKPAGG